MEKQKKIWLVVAIVVVVLIIIIALSGKKAPEPIGEEGLIPEGIDLENLPAAPEVKVSESEAIVPEASEVTSEGEVLALTGEVADNSSATGGSNAPQPSRILEQEEVEELEENKEAINLTVTQGGGFNPKQFKVKPNQVVTVILTSGDSANHGFAFKDMSLNAVSINVNAGESRAITFNAPSSVGVYEFCCSIPSHRRAGECGQMIVTNE